MQIQNTSSVVAIAFIAEAQQVNTQRGGKHGQSESGLLSPPERGTVSLLYQRERASELHKVNEEKRLVEGDSGGVHS